MKMMKIQILLMGTLLGNALSLQGMTTTSTRLRQLQKMRLQKGLPKKPINVPTQEPVNVPTQKPITQTWGNWFKSFFSTQPSKPVSYGTEESYTSPFERGGQKRSYSTSYHSSTQTQIPESFQPSLKSRIPWTNEYKIEELFKKMNDGLMVNIFPTWNQVQELKELIKVSGYNPLNRFIQGQPSFFAKILKMFLKWQGVDMSSYDRNVVEQLYFTMGARIRKDDQGEIIACVNNLFNRMGIAQIGSMNAKSRLKTIIEFASPMVTWYKFLGSIDIHIDIPIINWDKIEELCELELDPAKLHKTIEDLQKNPKELLNPNGMMVRVVIIGKYGRSNRPITGEYVINLLTQAGFSGIGARRQEYQEQQYGSQFGAGSFDIVKNKLIQLLGIPATATEKEISNAYRKFVMQYHPDVTKNPNNPMSLKLKNEINPAWDEYNEGLKQAKQARAGRE